MRKATTALAGVLTVALTVGLTTLADPAAAKTSVTPSGLDGVGQVSHTGRWIVGADSGQPGMILDRRTGATEPAWIPSPSSESGISRSIVRDNPELILEQEGVVPVVDPSGTTIGHRDGQVWLVDSAASTRTRIDTDGSGAPLEPTWTGMPDWEDPQFNAYPNIRVAPESVTRDGSVVAFCANYDVPTSFTLYIKNTVTGALSKRSEECGRGGPDPGGEYVWVPSPEISHNGRVVHLRGAIYSDGWSDPDAAFYPDTLVFLKGTRAPRTVRGNGSMTRDGKLIFMRIGVRAHGAPDRTGGKVGVYKISKKRTTKLRGKYLIYGTNALAFSAFDRATWRGRYVVYGNKNSVIDRKKGKVYNFGKVMRRHGFTPKKGTAIISGNGKLIFAFAKSSGEYVAVDWR